MTPQGQHPVPEDVWQSDEFVSAISAVRSAHCQEAIEETVEDLIYAALPAIEAEVRQRVLAELRDRAIAPELLKFTEAQVQKRLGEALQSDEAIDAADGAVGAHDGDIRKELLDALRAAWDAATGHSFSLEDVWEDSDSRR